MILRAGSSWQTVTADLALILFLITAQASRNTPAAPEQSDPVATTVAQGSGAGLAIYRPGAGTDLGEWLDMTLTDDRQGVTVVMRYPAGGRGNALRAGSELLDEVEEQGLTARLLLEPGPRVERLVLVGYEGEPGNGTILAEGL